MVAHFKRKVRQVSEVRRVISLERMPKTIVGPRLPLELVHHGSSQKVKRSLPTREDLAILERHGLKVAPERGKDVNMARTPSADALRLGDVKLTTLPVNVAP